MFSSKMREIHLKYNTWVWANFGIYILFCLLVETFARETILFCYEFWQLRSWGISIIYVLFHQPSYFLLHLIDLFCPIQPLKGQVNVVFVFREIRFHHQVKRIFLKVNCLFFLKNWEIDFVKQSEKNMTQLNYWIFYQEKFLLHVAVVKNDQKNFS